MNAGRPCRASVLVALAVFILGVSGVPSACHAGPDAKAVRTVRAQASTTSTAATAPGYLARVRGATETDLSFKLAGIIEVIGPERGRDWQEGATVKRGDLLARLVQADFRSMVSQAAAKAELEQKNLERARALLANNTISQQELDAAEASARASQAALAQAQQALADSELRAPFDGTILARLSNAGETVAPGQTVLRIADLSRMSIELGVPDHIVSRLKVGDEVPVSISALEGQVFSGRVDEVGVAAKPGSRLFKVVVKVPNADGLIRSGMTATVFLERAKDLPAGAVLVPLSALVTSTRPDAAGKLAVFVAGPDGRAYERVVETDEIVGSSIVITSGVQEGEEVVVAGASMLYDGAPVRTTPATATLRKP